MTGECAERGIRKGATSTGIHPLFYDEGFHGEFPLWCAGLPPPRLF